MELELWKEEQEELFGDQVEESRLENESNHDLFGSLLIL